MAPSRLPDRLPVAPLLPPPGSYTFVAANPPVSAPTGDLLAQLADIPASLGAFLGAAFPPFGPLPRAQPVSRFPVEEQVVYRIVGLIQYKGDEGEVIVETVAPSRAALHRQLMLGDPSGTLPDGSIISTMFLEEYYVRWLKDDFILSVSGSVPLDRLLVLAADVVLL